MLLYIILYYSIFYNIVLYHIISYNNEILPLTMVLQAKGQVLLNLRCAEAAGGLLGRTLLTLVSNKVRLETVIVFCVFLLVSDRVERLAAHC